MNRTLRHTLISRTTSLLLAPLAGLHAAEFLMLPPVATTTPRGHVSNHSLLWKGPATLCGS